MDKIVVEKGSSFKGSINSVIDLLGESKEDEGMPLR